MASEYLKWKYRDVRPDAPRELTPQERRANWWHYHKWHIAIAALLLLVLGNLGFTAWDAWRNAPDYQVAYVASNPLPDETAAALEAALSELAEGKRVALNQYLTAESGADRGMAQYVSASSVKLMADLDACESFLFLLEDPEAFQTRYEVLRDPPYLRWSDCPVLTSLPLGEYSETLMGQEVTGDGQALFDGLYLARRGYWSEEDCKDPEGCDHLWAAMTEGAGA